jgi:prevent-host-death family protein
MKTMIVSEFKAKCIGVLKLVEETGESLVITRRGRPVAEIEPIAKAGGRNLGSQRGYMKINGDIVRGEFADEWSMCGGDR